LSFAPGGSNANIAALTVGSDSTSATVFGHAACAEGSGSPYHFT
jgi:hypothetical protein